MLANAKPPRPLSCTSHDHFQVQFISRAPAPYPPPSREVSVSFPIALLQSFALLFYRMPPHRRLHSFPCWLFTKVSTSSFGDECSLSTVLELASPCYVLARIERPIWSETLVDINSPAYELQYSKIITLIAASFTESDLATIIHAFIPNVTFPILNATFRSFTIQKSTT